MKIIDAFWEKRNLGVTSVEVVIDQADSIEAIINALEKLDAEYQVVRVPVGRIDLYELLQKYGFNFIEAMCHPCYELSDFHSPFEEKENDVGYEEITSKEALEEIFRYVKDGMFNTDRISLDPHFSTDQSTNRYIGMIKDKLDQGAVACSIVRGENNIGFFVLSKPCSDIFDVVLTGLFPQYQGKGLGFHIVLQMLNFARDKGAKLLVSHVSVNNKKSFELHLKHGFKTAPIEYLFVKHT